MRDVIVGEKAIRQAWTGAEASAAKAAKAPIKAPMEWSKAKVPQTVTPILMPVEAGEKNRADGVVLRFELNPLQVVELPVHEVKTAPKQLKEPMWTEELLEIFRLNAALTRQDQAELQAIVEAIHGRGSLRLPGAEHAATVEELLRPENLTTYLGAAITTYQHTSKMSTTLVVWRDKQGRLRPGLLAPNERAAAFALAMRGYSLKAAKCPVCGGKFKVDEHHPGIYCSPRCRSKHNTRESRNRRRATKPRRRSA